MTFSSDIFEACQWRWFEIHQHFGLPKSVLNGSHQACPVCSAGKDCFRYTDWQGNGGYFCNKCGSGDGMNLLCGYTGRKFKELADDIRGILGEVSAQPTQGTDVSKIRAKLTKLWSDSLQIQALDPVDLYFKKRGIEVDLTQLHDLRFHPGVTYWNTADDKPVNTGDYPAMLGLIKDIDGKPATLHVTYLHKDGDKADVPVVKKTLSATRPWKGGAIQINQQTPGQVVGVAEGIESALKLKQFYPDIAVCSACNADNMIEFQPSDPDSPMIIIAGDNDQSMTGQAAAFELARMLTQKKSA